MGLIYAGGLTAGFCAVAALIALIWEMRANRIDRRRLEAERQAFEGMRSKTDAQRAAATLEAMRLADAAERQRRARDAENRAFVEELVKSLRSTMGRQDAATIVLVNELRRLTQALLVPLAAPRVPDVGESGIEYRPEREPMFPPDTQATFRSSPPPELP